MEHRAPKYLRKPTRDWWEHVAASYEMEGHHLRLLTLAAEAWDRAQQAREDLKKAKSLTYEDRFGCPKKRPEVAIQTESMVVFSRLIRELGLDVEEADPVRVRALARNGGKRA